MLLTVDVGNTQTVLGLFEGDRLVAHWRLATVRERTADEYRMWVSSILEMEGFSRHDVHGMAVSSVVPTATAALRQIGHHISDGTVVVVEPGVKTGMPILIDNPREVGADRVVNSVAAVAKYGAPAIVVDFGTATTFDVVGPGGDYIGGVIAPGLEVSMDGLIAATAALRRVELTPPRSVIGKGTVEAIQSGLLYGYAGLVDGIARRLLDELGDAASIVATGGLASVIVPHCEMVDVVDEFLTLDGLRLVFERTSEGER
jgi:type III pantothenate kinase